MKRIKKLASILLAVVMVLGMSLTAFAAEDNNDVTNTVAGEGNFTIKINDDTKGYKYAAYQIFTGDLMVGENGQKTLSNIKWGSGVDAEKVAKKYPGKTASDVAKEVLHGKENDSEAARNFAATIADCLSTATADSGETCNPYVISNLTAGYYLVQNTEAPSDGAYTRYMLEVVGDIDNVTPKRSIPTPDKKILDRQLTCTNIEEDHTHNDDCYTDKKVTANEASIGDKVNYEITGTMPSTIDDYKTYYYKFTDTLSKGLTYEDGSIEVKIGNVDVTKYFYKGVSNYDPTNGTTIEVSIADVKALAASRVQTCTDESAEHVHTDACYEDVTPIIPELTAATTIVVTYTAILNENAVIAGTGNPNDVKLTYSNDPNHSGDGSKTPPENPKEPKPTHPTGESPEVKVVTYTTELTILKTNEEKAFLPGVEFTLTGDGVNVVLVTEETFTEAADGEYWKLKDGTYTTTAPTDTDDETDNTDDYESTDIKYTKTTSVVAKGKGKTETDVVGTVQADGTVTFKGLGAGTYTITETKTLPGYNTIEPIKFTLTATVNETEKTVTFTSDNKNVTVGSDNMLDTSIENKKGSLLPSTGGIGTTIFYVVGGILVIGAGILLVAKKRMSAGK